VVTFEGLFSHTPFLKQMRAILEILQEVLDYPIDIEFAHDGECFYLLQCRAQSHHEHAIPAQIPRDIAREKVIFSAKRYITNGQVPGITHIVYVDPQKYSELSDYQSLVSGWARSRTAESNPSQTLLYPDGARTLGKPGRH
jgi:pyruvate, water dikinase